jgi:hypothetical protein
VEPLPHEPPPSSDTAAHANAAEDTHAPSPLKLAIRRARVEEAERSEVIAELRGAETARLEMLEEELRPVLADVPKDVDMFDMGLSPGERPRLFIDMIGFVEMGRDRRTYRFVQVTRYGRVIIAESERTDPIVSAVIDYVARRLLEREKALAADATLEPASRNLMEDNKSLPKIKPQYATRRLAERGQVPAGDTALKPAARSLTETDWSAANAKLSKTTESPSPAKPRSLLSRGFGFLIELLGSTLLFALLAIGAWRALQLISAWLTTHH